MKWCGRSIVHPSPIPPIPSRRDSGIAPSAPVEPNVCQSEPHPRILLAVKIASNGWNIGLRTRGASSRRWHVRCWGRFKKGRCPCGKLSELQVLSEGCGDEGCVPAPAPGERLHGGRRVKSVCHDLNLRTGSNLQSHNRRHAPGVGLAVAEQQLDCRLEALREIGQDCRRPRVQPG
jgi:hypothetical protein